MSNEYDLINFSSFFASNNSEDKWMIFKDSLLTILNEIAPEKSIKIKAYDSFP